jgi:hypothetical protein
MAGLDIIASTMGLSSICLIISGFCIIYITVING